MPSQYCLKKFIISLVISRDNIIGLDYIIRINEFGQNNSSVLQVFNINFNQTVKNITDEVNLEDFISPADNQL